MSLTSYRAAPPRVIVLFCLRRYCFERCVWQTWQRPTLPRLETKYHWRRGVSRPSSEWDRVQPPRCNHQVSKAQRFHAACAQKVEDFLDKLHAIQNEKLVFFFIFRFWRLSIFRAKPARPTGRRGFCRALSQRPHHRCDTARETIRSNSIALRWIFVMRMIKPIELLVPVSFMRCRTSTPGLSTWWSSTALIGNTRFQVGFPLRCLQRLSRPYIATRRCSWRYNRYTRGTSTPVLSY